MHKHSILDRRRAGILLHITSLPGGIHNGDLGQDAYRFVDFLVGSGISIWQTLPVNPTHGDGSPYQCLSAHAGNPLMIDLGWFAERGWLDHGEIINYQGCPRTHRLSCLEKAFRAFQNTSDEALIRAHNDFVGQHKKVWLDDFSLFMAIRNEHSGISWQDWPVELRDRKTRALNAARKRLALTIAQVQFEQFVFFRQWQSLREYANARGILLFGDIPIFVAGDSADVWSRQEEFDLKPDRQPRVVAGVPPDYFSATGQRWGNPHYRWETMQANGFAWWLERFTGQLALFDWIRIDHFRGFEAYWEIPAESETAMEGHWVKAPGKALLETLIQSVEGGKLPLIAENLGIITPEVEALREEFQIPGMLILQFAFDGGADNPYLPHNHDPNSVVYTGTHDNDTTASWFSGLTDQQRSHVYNYLGSPSGPMPDVLVHSALSSVARLAILPMQDLLGLGGEHRMNTPGTTEGNWTWRFNWDQVSDQKIQDLEHHIRMYGRYPG